MDTRVRDTHVIFLFGAGDFSASCSLPLFEGFWDLVSIKGVGVDHLVESLAELHDGAFSRECPVGC